MHARSRRLWIRPRARWPRRRANSCRPTPNSCRPTPNSRRPRRTRVRPNATSTASPPWRRPRPSAQDLDNAVQNNLAAKAQVAAAKAGIDVAQAAIVAAKAVVEAAKAQVATAILNLGFTTIVSPITGIAGIATAQIGDLVGPNSGTLTTVSPLDPIKVSYKASEQEFRTSY